MISFCFHVHNVHTEGIRYYNVTELHVSDTDYFSAKKKLVSMLPHVFSENDSLEFTLFYSIGCGMSERIWTFRSADDLP